ncbi:hypothetical protein R0J90_15190, partial [Micrococcus sp. SIMBA_144]
MSPIPLFGNLVNAKNVNNKPVLSPEIFNIGYSDKSMKNVQRNWRNNQFYYNPRTYNGRDSKVPFMTSAETFAVLASKEWGTPVKPSNAT